MNTEHYDIVAKSNRMVFEFVSKGPKGNIRKGIDYTLMYSDQPQFYNLGFGDIDEHTGAIDDLTVSDNNDRDKVLATVAISVLKFTENFPGAVVYAEGSTPARTRLYQMGIAANLSEIHEVLEVYGLSRGKLYLFEKNVNYEAFIVHRK